ncbi:hypothetical protein [Lactobacillus mulieris]|uniref:Uncharacterized protein n=1 Tax=Lactobacillus mulieris TaxID=2508708 RepID=A0AAW5WXP4_9LACO|nr:hypothetical protein [Lactobacillus mulieris]MCZ3621644.1 hypothetical protein [Lactobacillus mulieris]MCZ3623080.1 hypothetical protein [Lactobacillus mulieris]MCZ3635651.1 hypothetical protein [Lactobacillus mulieris]MCZ3690049.1 hypothetical protein [Lactobacillus mulieris]MCZ3695987.1 hypothetical protein [Lactobacillus mulieris]
MTAFFVVKPDLDFCSCTDLYFTEPSGCLTNFLTRLEYLACQTLPRLVIDFLCFINL